LSVRKSPEKLQTINICWKSKASLRRNLSTGTPPNFFSTTFCFIALVYNWYFFQNAAVLRKLFDIRFSYKHCNFSHVCLVLVKKPTEGADISQLIYLGLFYVPYTSAWQSLLHKLPVPEVYLAEKSTKNKWLLTDSK